jgi:hypothetical protein
MPFSKELRVVDETFFDTAATTVQIAKRIPCNANTLFALLADAPAWVEWLGADSVEYTSDPPHGVGSTRKVFIRRQWIDERFITWEPGKRLAFYGSASTLPLAAFAEDFAITPDGADHCVLSWTTAIDGRPKLLSSSLGIAARANGNRTLNKLVVYVNENKNRYQESA